MWLSKIEDNIELIAKANPQALDPSNIKKLVRYYWKHIDNIPFPMSEEDHERATSEESITRSRRKIRERLGIKDDVTDFREIQYREHYSQEHVRL